jgi:hypothetical protein
MRKMPIIVAGLGIVSIVGAGFAKWPVADRLVKLPDDTNVTRTFSGNATTLLNPPALASGNTSQAVLHNVPIVATHQTKVLRSHSHSALIADTKSLSAAGAPVSSSTYNYAVDRKDMARGSGFTGATEQNGITFNFPIHTAKHDYTGWISDTSKSTALMFTGTAKRGGVHTYVFTTQAAAAPITDVQQLSKLPSTLPKAQLPALAAANGISPTLLASAQTLLGQLPANIPLSYTYQLNATYYVAPASGVVVDLVQHEVRSVGVAGISGLPTFPVADISFTSTPATLKAAAKDARDKGRNIDVVETIVPWSMLGGGVLLVLIAIGLWLFGSRRPASASIVLPPAEVDLSDKKIPAQRETQTDAPTEAKN